MISGLNENKHGNTIRQKVMYVQIWDLIINFNACFLQPDSKVSIRVPNSIHINFYAVLLSINDFVGKIVFPSWTLDIRMPIRQVREFCTFSMSSVLRLGPPVLQVTDILISICLLWAFCCWHILTIELIELSSIQ